MFLDTIALPLGSIGEAATRTLVHGTAAMTTISETLAALAHAYGQLDLPTAAGLWVIILALGLAGPALAARRQRGLHAARSAADEGTSSDRRSPSDFMQQAGLADDEEAPDHIGRYLATGSIMAAVMVVGLGGWASTTELAGAVLAQGTVVVDSKVKKVQHPTGGIVGEIRVKDGDSVKAGDILIKLDETITRANLLTVTTQLDELDVRKARLFADRDGANVVTFPPDLVQRRNEPSLLTTMQSEQTLFENRRTARDGQRSQLRERAAQLASEIEGVHGQVIGKSAEIKLAKAEIDRLVPLEFEHYVPATKMNGTRRDLARLEGELSQLTSAMAQAKQKIAETELQMLQLDQDMHSEVSKELRELQGKEAELIERKVTAQDQLGRIEIWAPQAGIVHQLSVHTIGGVIAQGEPIMMIVPEDDQLVIEAKIAPSDIDHVRPNQVAFIRFPAFNQRTTPEFSGHVTVLSADLTRDTGGAQPGPPYYLARIALAAEDLTKLGALRLVPGMPAEVHIETPKRTAMSYLVKPLADQIAVAFKEK